MPREREFRWDQVHLYSVYELDVVFPWNSIPSHFFPQRSFFYPKYLLFLSLLFLSNASTLI